MTSLPKIVKAGQPLNSQSYSGMSSVSASQGEGFGGFVPSYPAQQATNDFQPNPPPKSPPASNFYQGMQSVDQANHQARLIVANSLRAATEIKERIVKEGLDEAQRIKNAAYQEAYEKGREIVKKLGEVAVQEGIERGIAQTKAIRENARREGFEQGMAQTREIRETARREGFEYGLSQCEPIKEAARKEGYEQGMAQVWVVQQSALREGYKRARTANAVKARPHTEYQPANADKRSGVYRPVEPEREGKTEASTVEVSTRFYPAPEQTQSTKRSAPFRVKAIKGTTSEIVQAVSQPAPGQECYFEDVADAWRTYNGTEPGVKEAAAETVVRRDEDKRKLENDLQEISKLLDMIYSRQSNIMTSITEDLNQEAHKCMLTVIDNLEKGRSDFVRDLKGEEHIIA